MVVFDTNYIIHLLHPKPGTVLDPTTDRPVKHVKDRIENLLAMLGKVKEKILIPTPVLCELFSLADDRASDYLAIMIGTYHVELASFDAMAAIEAGIQNRAAKQRGDKRDGTTDTLTKVKFDRQIVAIAKTRNAARIYSNDKNLGVHASRVGIEAVPIWMLPEPPQKQQDLFEPVAEPSESPDDLPEGIDDEAAE